MLTIHACQDSKIQCIPSFSVQENINIDIASQDDFDFGCALEAIYPLLHTVFGYLTRDELLKVSKVKKSWDNIATEILQKRHAPEWILYYKPKSSRTKIGSSNLEVSNNFKYTNSDLVIIFTHTTLKKQVCVHKNGGSIKMKFSDYLKEEIVPSNIKYCIIASSKLYSIFSKQSSLTTLYTGLVLPVIPNIRTEVFYASVDTIQEQRNNLMMPNDKIKALLIFCITENQENTLEDFLKIVVADQNPHEIALGGGLVRDIENFTTNNENVPPDHYFCITFIENCNELAEFSAYSFVFLQKLHEFQDQLVKLKEKMIFRKHIIAIRICCAAKRYKTKEPDIFSKVFPDVPLFSIDCDGEIGWDTTFVNSTLQDEQERKKRKHSLLEAEHQWTSIIVFLMWGKKT